jgi:RNA polymerase sigma-70 factor (ECF subfamily)
MPRLAFRAPDGESCGRVDEPGMNRLTESLRMEAGSLFERAYLEYKPALTAFVRRRVRGDTETADIVQEAYLRLLRYRDSPDLNALKALLFQITIHLLGERSRVARVQQLAAHVPFEDSLSPGEGAPSHDRQIAGEQDLKRLMAAIELLPRKCQEVFILRRFHGLSCQEISERLGISMKTVEKHVTNALTRCRKRVGGDAP